jgi:hypothetical protein
MSPSSKADKSTTTGGARQGELPSRISEQAIAFVEQVHERVFKPQINENNQARLEAVRDAMLLRVKLCQTRQELDQVLQNYTSVGFSDKDMPW